MDSQQEIDVLDMRTLEIVLGMLPDQASANILREQVLSACQIVRQKRQDAAVLISKTETERAELQKIRSHLEVEREELRKERAKLLKAAEQVETVPGRINDLARSNSTMAEKLDVTKGEVTNITAEFDKLNQVVTNSVQSNEQAIASIHEANGNINTAIQAVVVDQNLIADKIKESLEDGFIQKSLDSVTKPLVEDLKATSESIAGLPSKSDLKEWSNSEDALWRQSVQSLIKQTMDDCWKEFTHKAALDYSGKIIDLKAECESKVNEVNDLRQVNRNLGDDLRLLDIQNARDLAGKDALLSNANQVIEDERARVSRRNEEIETQLNYHRSLEEQLNHLQSELSDARASHQQLEEVRSELRNAEVVQVRLLQELDDTKARLQAAQGYQEQLNEARFQLEQVSTVQQQLDTANSRLTEAEAVRQHLNQTCSHTKEQLKQLHTRFEEATELQKELKESRQFELNTLNNELSNTSSLLENTQKELEDCRERADNARSEANTLQSQLDEAKSLITNEEMLSQRLADANSRLDNAKGLEKDLADVKSRLIESERQLAAKEAEHTVRLPEGITGHLAAVYYNLAEEVRGIPTAPEKWDGFELQPVAVKIAPLLTQFGARERLLSFLNARSGEWHCVKQVVTGRAREVLTRGQCQQHNGECVL
ncbi:hypothetical protein ACHAPJ_011262, partial [Fusarium lateritium]